MEAQKLFLYALIGLKQIVDDGKYLFRAISYIITVHVNWDIKKVLWTSNMPPKGREVVNVIWNNKNTYCGTFIMTGDIKC